MRFEENITKITSAITELVQPEKIILFGSRTHGTAHRYSDYDIALVGANMDHRTERRLKQVLDDRLGIFNVDLVNVEKIDPKFREIISQNGVVVYEN